MDGADQTVPFAHSRNDAGHRQPLVDHLAKVAEMAAKFAAPFGGEELAHWAGLWHDLGKFHPDFQRYLLEAEADSKGRRRGPGHKAAGACLAESQPAMDSLAFLIAGHHGGLPDRHGKLKQLLAENRGKPNVDFALALAEQAIEDLLPRSVPAYPGYLGSVHRLEFFLRMLFSALVDADFLDTERHFQSDVADDRAGAPDLVELQQQLEAHQAQVSGQRDDPVNRIRHEVYLACLAAAEQSPGFFRLTVPTGGGKTRSGLAFALRHANRHGLDRVIVAIPYTSITDQTASDYRSIFTNPRAILEHHSAIRHVDREDGVLPDWSRLAAQNWDAPIVVTTTVQLFESLLGQATTACRKLHNIARSVIILDEVQTLPPGLLEPILDVLRDLVANYGVSVVLCTATQPALDARSGFPGINGVREIVPDPARLFMVLKRVEYSCQLEETWSWERAAGEMRREPQALAIVNTKRDAIDLLTALDDPEAFHLSTLLCGAHRRAVLEEVRRRLKAGEPCRLVSTQVVEAGVDLDFPLVLRALGPLDRIVQAAGRCNRNGRQAVGRVIIFDPAEGSMPPGAYRSATETTRHLLKSPGFDFHDPATYETFFQRYYDVVSLDAKKVQSARAALDYPEVASRFRLITDDTVPVVVPYPNRDSRPLQDLLKAFRRGWGSPRELWRQIQPFTVAVRARMIEEYQRDGLLTEVVPGLWEWCGRYDERMGLIGGRHDPTGFVI